MAAGPADRPDQEIPDLVRERGKIVPVEASVNSGLACDDILQVRKSCGLKLAGLGVLELGADLVHDLDVGGILELVDHYECIRV